MSKRILSSLFTILVLCALLFGAKVCHQRLVSLSSIHQLTETALDEQLPPDIAFTTLLLGSFRGIIADFLWLRVMDCQAQGNYFEIVSLSQWITKLQPRFITPWTFLAWNMAYNITVEFSDYRERWRWVKNAIQLLRDEAIRYNPQNEILYRQLGWIFQHKIGEVSDDAHFFYKNAWALDMMLVIGDPLDSIEVLKGISLSLDDLKKDPDVVRFLRYMDEHNFNFLERYFFHKEKYRRFPTEINEWINRLENQQAYRSVVRFLKARRLRLTLKLDPALMLELDQKYGPLDWRMPQAHAIYWSYKGLLNAAPERTIFCHRMIFQSMLSSLKQGRMMYDPADGSCFFLPNIAIVDNLYRMFQDMHTAYNPQVLHAAYRSFLKSAVVLLYSFNKQTEAAQYFAILKKEFAREITAQTIEQFVLQDLTELLKESRVRETRATILGLLQQSYWAVAMGESDRAAGLERMAFLVWRSYMKKELREGLQMPSFKEMKRNILMQCLTKDFPLPMQKRLAAAIQQDGT